MMPYSAHLNVVLNRNSLSLSKGMLHFILHSMDDPSVLSYDPLETKQCPVSYVSAPHTSLLVEFSHSRRG